ncbi:MAG: TlpA family protein disulfide reductase [marine benthic group bacterium]|nr:TlpA family protein disulfide reductase [Candidatus Benthicola marisminoris]
MAKRSPGQLALDILVAAAAVLALTLLVRERVIPWILERTVLDPGEIVKEDPAFLDARTGASLEPADSAGLLLFVFRSTCPVCEQAVPSWKRLAHAGDWRAAAVGLEGPEPAVAYMNERLPGVPVAVPIDLDRFTRRFRITVVPTTLLIDREGRLAARHAGPLEESVERELRRLAAPPSPDSR